MFNHKINKIVQLVNAMEERMQILKTLFIKIWSWSEYIWLEPEYLSKYESECICVYKVMVKTGEKYFWVAFLPWSFKVTVSSCLFYIPGNS